MATLALSCLPPAAQPAQAPNPATPVDLAETMSAVDILRTTLRVRLQPERGALEVEGAVRLTSRRDGVSSARLVLAEAFGSPRFMIADQPRDTSWQPLRWSNADARLWTIPFPEPLQKGKSLEIAFRYDGRPDWPLDGRITPRLSWMLPQAAWFPRLGTGRVAGDDWSELDLTISAPEGFAVVANGEPVPGKEPSGSGASAPAVHHWRSRLHGSPYFVAGPFTVTSETGSGKKLGWYGPVAATSARIRNLQSGTALRAVIRNLEPAFGPYPQPRLAVIQMPEPWPTGDTVAVPGAILFDPRPPDPTRLAHEIAHQWWGLSVQTPLLEGLARYAEWLVQRDGATGVSARAITGDGAKRPDPSSRPVAPSPHRPVASSIGGIYPDFAARFPDLPLRDALFRFEEPQRTALAYDKLGAVLRMLSDVIGEERFHRLLRDFHRRYAGQRAGLAEFQILARGVAKQDLDGFFNQWINAPGLPTIRLERVTARPEGRGYRLTLHTTQARPPFRLPVDVAIETAKESESARVELTEMEQQIEINTRARPLAVELDPGGRVLLDRRDARLQYRLLPADLSG
jgi:aminopeptidase N